MQTICRVLLVCVNMITEITLHPLSTFTAFHQVLFKFTLQNKSTIRMCFLLEKCTNGVFFFLFQMAAFIERPWQKMSHCSWLSMGPISCDFADQWQSDSPLPTPSTTLACQYTGLHLYQTPRSSVPGSLYLLLRSGMPVITALSTQINSIRIFISPRPRPGSLLALSPPKKM